VLVQVGLAAAGLALMILAADHLVLGASRVAVRLRITPMVVGVVVIGLGTSTPEFLVAGLAAGQDKAEMALGSLVGSNVVNVTLVLGIASVIAPIAVYSTTVRREAPMSAASVALFAAAILLGLGPWVGLGLAAATVGALWALVRLARAAPEAPVTSAASRDGSPPLGRESLRVLLGLAGTLAGAQLLVVNAENIAVQLGVSQVVIGFTLVAIGTSLPELVTAVQAQRRGEADLLVGNLLGSNLFNSLAGGAVVGLAAGPGPHLGIGLGLLGAMLGLSLISWLILWRGVTRWEGAVLLLLYLACLPLLM
jgi:cation:H+ antiporter